MTASKPHKRPVRLPCNRGTCTPTNWCEWCQHIHGIEEQLDTARHANELLESANQALKERNQFLSTEQIRADVLQEQLESARGQRDALAAECRQALGFITHMDMSYRFAEWIRGELNPTKDRGTLGEWITGEEAKTLARERFPATPNEIPDGGELKSNWTPSDPDIERMDHAVKSVLSNPASGSDDAA